MTLSSHKQTTWLLPFPAPFRTMQLCVCLFRSRMPTNRKTGYLPRLLNHLSSCLGTKVAQHANLFFGACARIWNHQLSPLSPHNFHHQAGDHPNTKVALGLCLWHVLIFTRPCDTLAHGLLKNLMSWWKEGNDINRFGYATKMFGGHEAKPTRMNHTFTENRDDKILIQLTLFRRLLRTEYVLCQ